MGGIWLGRGARGTAAWTAWGAVGTARYTRLGSSEWTRDRALFRSARLRCPSPLGTSWSPSPHVVTTSVFTCTPPGGTRKMHFVYSDYADLSWACHGVKVAADTFERHFGERPKRCRQGRYFLPEQIVDVSVEVASTRTPYSGTGPQVKTVTTCCSGRSPPPTAPTSSAYPRYLDIPSRSDVGLPAANGEEALLLVVIPLSSFDYETAVAPVLRRLTRRLRWIASASAPTGTWWKSRPDPHTYWDLVWRAIQPVTGTVCCDRHPLGPARPRRSLSTFAPCSSTCRNTRISARLSFVDPLTFWPAPPPPTDSKGACTSERRSARRSPSR